MCMLRQPARPPKRGGFPGFAMGDRLGTVATIQQEQNVQLEKTGGTD